MKKRHPLQDKYKISESELIRLLDDAECGDDADKRTFLKAMRKTNWTDYRKFRARLADVLEAEAKYAEKETQED